MSNFHNSTNTTLCKQAVSTFKIYLHLKWDVASQANERANCNDIFVSKSIKKLSKSTHKAKFKTRKSSANTAQNQYSCIDSNRTIKENNQRES